jgi:DNA-binding CsgD family transcriptional regulator
VENLALSLRGLGPHRPYPLPADGGTLSTRLGELGLDADCAATYLHLLGRVAASPAALVQPLRMREPDVRRTLVRLARMGLARPARAGVSGAWAAVDPATALVRLAEHRIRAVNRSFLEALQLVGNPAVEFLSQPEELIDRLLAAAQPGSGELVEFRPARHLNAGSGYRLATVDHRRQMIGSGHRVVYDDAAIQAGAPTGRWAPPGGVRQTPHLPVWLAIVDDAVGLVSDGTPIERECVWVCDPAVVQALRVLFERVWVAARPVSDAEPPSPQERALLRLLADGHTDGTAARRLGVSVRTVRRLVASVMTRTAASSRFEAGIRAREHGWV